jgi:hypothetical protein
MAQIYNDSHSGFWRCAGLWALLLGAFCLTPTAFGLTRAELYQTVVPLADRSEPAQSAAFQAGLKDVIVRVTGRRMAGEEATFAALIGNARRYVQQYRAAPDKKLWVSFDGPAIERWLTQNGQPLWGADRPTTFIWLDVPSAQNSVITADDTSDLKTSLDALALVRGVPLLWPTAADIARPRGDVGSVAAVSDLSHARGGDAILIGHAANNSATASVRWTHIYNDRSSDFAGTLEGINRAADTYASLLAASGALAPVDIAVGGIADLKDYANVQGYLESQTFISHVSLIELAGDVASFRLSTRGGLESLQRSLALGAKLQSLPAGDNGLARFQLRH